MTEQEAVEVVLRGRVYETCTNCDGGGRQQLHGGMSGRKKHMWGWRPFDSRRVGGAEICKQCSGAGVQTMSKFQEACQILGIEITSKPNPPHRPFSSGEWLFDEQTQEWVDVS